MKRVFQYGLLMLFVLGIVFDRPILFAQEDNNFQFKRFNTDDGLSQISILDLLEDDQGLLWIGTRNGLNVFNGFNFRTFYHDPWDSTTLIFNRINALDTDKSGGIWVGTENGVCRYDRKLDQFERLDHSHITDKEWRVHDLFVDSFENVWIAGNTGVYVLPNGKNRMQEVEYDFSGPDNQSKYVNNIIEDEINNLWFGGDAGLFYYEKNEETFTIRRRYGNTGENPIQSVRAVHLATNNDLLAGGVEGRWHINLATDSIEYYANSTITDNGLQSFEIRKISKGFDGNLLVASYLGALEYDHINREFINRIHHRPDNPMSLSDNSIHSMLITSRGDFWLGTYSGGLNYVAPGQYIFEWVRHAQSSKKSLNSNVINGFIEGPDDRLYVATSRGGLNIYDPRTETFSFKLEPYNLRDLVFDNEGQLWIGSYFDGLIRYDIEKDWATFYNQRDNQNGNYIDDHGTRHNVLVDANENLWVGVWNAIYLYNRETDDFTKFPYEEVAIEEYRMISHIMETNGLLWILTNVGAHVFDLKWEKFVKHYTSIPGDISSLPTNRLTAGVVDKEGMIWIGSEVGISRFNPSDESFLTFTHEDGLPSNLITCMLADEENNIWVSTANGLAKFSSKDLTFRLFDETNNLQSNAFRRGACYACKDGTFLFGGINGYNRIDPSHVPKEVDVPPVIFTDLELFNQKVEPVRSQFLAKSLSFTDTLTLSYSQNVFTINYTTVDFSDPWKNNYAYMLEGFDENWNQVGNKREATYTNLEPNVYSFRVKASNENGVWGNKESVLTIVITPPFWKTTWFRLLIFAFIVVVVIAVDQYRQRSLLKLTKTLDYKVKMRTQVIEDQKTALEDQNVSLQQAEEEVRTANDQLKSMNDNLELIVEERTQKIKHQNEKIREVAFLNSHRVRAPLVRILGLINIFKNDQISKEDMDEVMTNVAKSATELDEITREINNELNQHLDE